MSAYKSKTYPVQATREQVFAKLANPGALAEKVKNLPPDVQQKLESVKFTDDAVSFNIPPVGEMRMVFTERVAPSRIVIGPESSPVPFALSINIGEGADGNATIETAMDIELNMFLRQMVGGKIEEGIDRMAEMLTHLPYGGA